MDFKEQRNVALHTSLTLRDVICIDSLMSHKTLEFDKYIHAFTTLGRSGFKEWVKIYSNGEIDL